MLHVPGIHRVKSRTCKNFNLRKAEARAQSQQLVLYTLQEEKKLNNLEMLKEVLVSQLKSGRDPFGKWISLLNILLIQACRYNLAPSRIPSILLPAVPFRSLHHKFSFYLFLTFFTGSQKQQPISLKAV